MPQNNFGPSDTANSIAKTPGIAVAGIRGTASKLNITTPTVVKATQGSLIRVSVVVAGTAAGGVFDANTTNGNVVGNQTYVIPNTVGNYPQEWPMLTGILVVPGTGQTVSVSYS